MDDWAAKGGLFGLEDIHEHFGLHGREAPFGGCNLMLGQPLAPSKSMAGPDCEGALRSA